MLLLEQVTFYLNCKSARIEQIETNCHGVLDEMDLVKITPSKSFPVLSFSALVDFHEWSTQSALLWYKICYNMRKG